MAGSNRGKFLTKFVLKLLLLPILAGAAVLTIQGFMSYNNHMNMLSVVSFDNIYKNIHINGIDVGGLTQKEALNKVESVFQSELDKQTITVRGGETEYIFLYDEFNAKLDFSGAVEQAYGYAREGALEERYSMIMALENAPYEITYEPEYTYDDSSAQEKVELIADKVYIPPQNATINRVDKQYVITKEVSGKALDAPATTAPVKQLLAERKTGVVDAVLMDVEAPMKEAYVSQAQSLIGTFTTSFNAGAGGRSTNIRTAGGKIDGWAIQPGEIFSTNNALGDQTMSNGYAKAPVIVNGKLEEGVGGGVCQVSSTLYNAVLFAELEVVERTNHSLKVGYLDYAFDATLAGDYLDFKFRNDTDLPVFLECFTNGGKLTVNVYGKEIHDAGRSLKFHSQYLGSASSSINYGLYKTVYENGAQVETEQVNTSKYKTSSATVQVGSRR